MRTTFFTTGGEHLGVGALAAYLKVHGHEVEVVYEPQVFSKIGATPGGFLSRHLEPTPEEMAARIAATRPDVVAISSYSQSHYQCVEVARAVKQMMRVPIVFGGSHVSGAPAHITLLYPFAEPHTATAFSVSI